MFSCKQNYIFSRPWILIANVVWDMTSCTAVDKPLLKILALKMYAAHFTEMFALTHQNTRHNIPEESNFNFKFNLVLASGG